jgi:hypothetical protein
MTTEGLGGAAVDGRIAGLRLGGERDGEELSLDLGLQLGLVQRRDGEIEESPRIVGLADLAENQPGPQLEQRRLEALRRQDRADAADRGAKDPVGAIRIAERDQRLHHLGQRPDDGPARGRRFLKRGDQRQDLVDGAVRLRLAAGAEVQVRGEHLAAQIKLDVVDMLELPVVVGEDGRDLGVRGGRRLGGEQVVAGPARRLDLLDVVRERPGAGDLGIGRGVLLQAGVGLAAHADVEELFQGDEALAGRLALRRGQIGLQAAPRLQGLALEMQAPGLSQRRRLVRPGASKSRIKAPQGCDQQARR